MSISHKFEIALSAAEAIKKSSIKMGRRPMVRAGIRGGGCTGFAYVLEFVEQKNEHDLEFHSEGVSVIIDPKSMVYLNGSILDYISTTFGAGFKFKNPNSKGECSCGESIQF